MEDNNLTIEYVNQLQNETLCAEFKKYFVMPTAHYTTRHDKTTPDKKIV